MDEISKKIQQEGSEYTELPEHIATAVEETEEVVANEEKVQAEIVDPLAELEYADGKARDEVDLIEEQEKIMGTNIISPFKTADVRVFRKKLEAMDHNQMAALAERVAARTYSVPADQKEELMRAFHAWASTNGFVQTDASKKAEKGARSEAFEGATSVNSLEATLKEKTLSDLQATAARLGFNPGYDRGRLITAIIQEYRRQA